MPKFPFHIIYLLANVCKESTLFKTFQHIPQSSWSERCRACFYSMGVNMPPELETTAQEMTVNMSRIPNPDAGLGMFAFNTTGKDMVVEYYYGSLDFASLTQERHTTKTYRVGVVQVTVEIFRKRVIDIREK